MPCTMCGGLGYLLGKLGRLFHYRCRQCGWTFAAPNGPSEEVEP